MRRCKVVRALARDRLVVVVEEHGSVLEIQLDAPLGKDEFTRALCTLSPFQPASALVNLGDYSKGVFYGSHAQDLVFPLLPERQKVDYSQRSKKRAIPSGPP